MYLLKLLILVPLLLFRLLLALFSWIVVLIATIVIFPFKLALMIKEDQEWRKKNIRSD